MLTWLLFWMQVFDTEIIAILMKVVINLITLNTPGVTITAMQSQTRYGPASAFVIQ